MPVRFELRPGIEYKTGDAAAGFSVSVATTETPPVSVRSAQHNPQAEKPQEAKPNFVYVLLVRRWGRNTQPPAAYFGSVNIKAAQTSPC